MFRVRFGLSGVNGMNLFVVWPKGSAPQRVFICRSAQVSKMVSPVSNGSKENRRLGEFSIERDANKQSCKSLLTANACDALVGFRFIYILQLDAVQSYALLGSDFQRVFYYIDLFSFRLVNRLVAAAIEQEKPTSERLFEC